MAGQEAVAIMRKKFASELLGTFLLVFFGCGAVAGETLFNAFGSLLLIAAIWGIGVALAISLTGPLSGAHLNPAITLSFALLDGFPKKLIPLYLSGQFAGAFLAASSLYLLFGPTISAFEASEGIVRGREGSEQTARIFGEFHSPTSSLPSVFFAEFLGTLLLAFCVFRVVDLNRANKLPEWLLPIMIGLSLTVLISIFAPISMAGFNPARDLAPRIFSSLAGWQAYPFQANGISWLVTYVIAPFLGAPLGAYLARKCL